MAEPTTEEFTVSLSQHREVLAREQRLQTEVGRLTGELNRMTAQFQRAWSAAGAGQHRRQGSRPVQAPRRAGREARCRSGGTLRDGARGNALDRHSRGNRCASELRRNRRFRAERQRAMSGPEHTARSERVERSKHDSTPPTFWPPGDPRREVLRDELAHYAAAWLSEIRKRQRDHDESHPREANAVMVPPGFAAVAAGSTIAGLAVITPALVEDWALELPYVCRTILPKEVSR